MITLFTKPASGFISAHPALLLMMAFAITTPSQAVEFDFSGTTDFSGNFTEAGETASATFTRSSTAGIGGTGGLGVAGSPDSIFYNTPITGFANGTTTITLSVFYKATTNASGGANVSIATGLATGTSTKIGTSDGTPWLILTMNSTAPTTAGTGSDFQISFRGNDGSTTSNTGAGNKFKVTNGNWYKFTTTYIYDEATSLFSATALVENYGASGTDAPTVVSTFSSAALNKTISLASISSADQLYTAIRTGNLGYGGASQLDNIVITVVPEPARASAVFAGLAALAGAAMLAIRKPLR